MGKLKKNESGFSAVEVILVLVIVAMLGSVGWYVWSNRSKNITTNTSTSTNASTTKPASTTTTPVVDKYKGWKTYTDANLSLRYPTNWSVVDRTKLNGPTDWVQIESAVDTNIQINKGVGTVSHQRLEFNISPLSSSTSTTCREACKIYDAISLSIPKASNSRLVISDWDTQGHAQALEVIDDTNAVIGAKTYKLGATINGKQIRISGDVGYNTDWSLGWINDVPSFEKTQAFQSLVKVLNSITIK